MQLKDIRKQFPALCGETIYMDNAGGSQVPFTVVDRIRKYMLETYVQLGADYEVAKRADAVVDGARRTVETFMNSRGVGKIALGSSTSAMCYLLAESYGRAFNAERDEIVVAEAGHEANTGPWMRIADRGYKIKSWRLCPETMSCHLDDLEDLITERTRIVAVPHVSNIFGEIIDIEAVCEKAHAKGARVVVDGVAYAPHRPVDVAKSGVDWYVYSAYKVFGPHMAALFGRDDAFAEIVGQNHFFVDDDDNPYKFELGGVLHEGCAGLLGVGDYLRFLAGEKEDAQEETTREHVVEAYARIEALELPLQQTLIDYLNEKSDVRIVGPSHGLASRVSTVSFVHESKSSKEIVLAANDMGLGIRYGHFYAYRLCEGVKLVPEDGVVRVSMLHYNSPEELNRAMEILETIF